MQFAAQVVFQQQVVDAAVATERLELGGFEGAQFVLVATPQAIAPFVRHRGVVAAIEICKICRERLDALAQLAGVYGQDPLRQQCGCERIAE